MSTAQTLHFFLPGRLTDRSGGSIYDRRIVNGLIDTGWQVTVHELDPGFPFPNEAALAHAAQAFASLPDGALVVVDGLALGALPALAVAHADRLRLVALVHHPLALETGLAQRVAVRLRLSEYEALAVVRHVIVTSATTAGALADYSVTNERITVVAPGTDARALSKGSSDPIPTLLCVASLTPRKGHRVLFEALARIHDRAWRLVCVGSDARDPDTARGLRSLAVTLDLEQRIELTGELDDDALEARFKAADIFVLASHYEGYGMVFDEAIAHGLPVVATRGGAIDKTVPADVGLLVAPDDPQALATAIVQVLDDGVLRARLRDAAIAAAQRRRSWSQAVGEFSAVLGRMNNTHSDGFSDEWLALREPADRHARADELVVRLSAWATPRGDSGLTIVDLGAGTGSNLRHLVARLGHDQAWLLLDHDPILLGRLPHRLAEWAQAHGYEVHGLDEGPASSADHALGGQILLRGEGFSARVTRRQADLSRDIAAVIQQAFEALPSTRFRLVTGSALLDLVGAPWLAELVGACHQQESAAFFVLSYDGSVVWAPSLPADELVREAFNRHQTLDKGLGLALGPAAGRAAAVAFEAAGFNVNLLPSPWQLGPQAEALQATIIGDWSATLADWLPDDALAITAWRDHRLRIAAQSRLDLSHVDLLALPR